MIKIEYNQKINELCDKIHNNKLKYKNTVIIGDNSTGKSSLLEELNKIKNTTLISSINKREDLNYLYNRTNIILIDNIETMLSYNEILDINNYIYNNFKNKQIIIVTHNLELVARLKNFNIIAMYKSCYGIYDSNDFNTYNNVINIMKEEDNTIDVILATLLNLKLNNLWSTTEQLRLLDIKKRSLTSNQLQLLEQIINI